ncbi:hypothetical protein [Halorussus amylolyticus]|uniref:hypothetical protein n=1 Tax=Halorussus amylolyticus TaxID=1126242 RepID=UPI00104E8AC9|nr:hypothetical protein [Halorussus amylolyticus]
MQKYTEFETKGEHVVARPRNSTEEPVRLPKEVADRGDDQSAQGNWEDVVAQLTRHELGETLTINEVGEGTISRNVAVDALVNAEETYVRGETGASALIDYLASEEIFEIGDDGGDVVVLKSPSEALENNPKMLNNWAATLDTSIDRIETAVQRVKDAQERLKKHEQDVQSDVNLTSRTSDKKAEIKQEIQSHLAGRHPSELDDTEYQRFKQLRKRYHMYESMEKVKEDGDIAESAGQAQKLGELVEDFETVQATMAEIREDFRELALKNDLFPQNAVEQLDNFVDIVTGLTDTFGPEDKMEEQSDEEFLDDLMDNTGQIEEVSESVESVDQVLHDTA